MLSLFFLNNHNIRFLLTVTQSAQYAEIICLNNMIIIYKMALLSSELKSLIAAFLPTVDFTQMYGVRLDMTN